VENLHFFVELERLNETQARFAENHNIYPYKQHINEKKAAHAPNIGSYTENYGGLFFYGLRGRSATRYDYCLTKRKLKSDKSTAQTTYIIRGV